MEQSMNITRSTDNLSAINTGLLAVGVSSLTDTHFQELDAAFSGHLSKWANEREFSGKAASTLMVPTFGNISATALLLVGLGDASSDEIRNAAAKIGREARTLKCRDVAIAISSDAGEILEWLLAGNYKYEVYKPTDGTTPAIENLTLVGCTNNGRTSDDAIILAKHQSAARDLVNAPPADLYPETLAAYAKTLGDIKNVTVEVLDTPAYTAAGYVGMVAVGQGSARPGRMIHVRYRPANATAHIGLVGKGVTYDSGGLSLKPSAGQQTMRCDMGGAATVLGAAGAIAELGIPVNMDVVVGAVENMTGGAAYKLGDILTYNNGVTVEIHNTDAEGRLVLADCLIRASNVEGLTHLVDAATLTGACALAVGSDFTGLFTKSDTFADTLSTAAKTVGEGLWRLPLHEPYKASLKGTWSQIKNLGDREGGASNAASFLEHFVKEGTTWAHLDIAGSAFHNKPSNRYVAGATGEMVRTLVKWVETI